MKFLRNILIITVPIYYVIVWTRNRFYDLGILPSKSYELPIICVGNLSVGGTGKTPMIEYLIRLLQEDHKLATLSRGYKRNTKGFILADETASAESIGDEPFQFYSKFKSVKVSVDANRQRGISTLMAISDAPEVILLDDAFQHRKVNAGLYILLTTFDALYVDDILLPSGNLREPISGGKRAEMIVVTKSPPTLEMTEKERIRKKLKLKPHQQLFFGHIAYSDYIYNNGIERSIGDLKNIDFTLVTGIANSKPLVNYLKAIGLNFDHLKFKDHHKFSEKELKSIEELKCVLTTEKDFMRLTDRIKSDNIYYLPIETRLDQSDRFDSMIKNFVRS